MIDGIPSPDDFGDAESILSGAIHTRRCNCEIWTALYGVHKLCLPKDERYVPKRDRTDYAAFIAKRPPPKSQFEAIGRIVYGTDPEEITVSMDELWEDAKASDQCDYIVVCADLGPAGFKGEVTLTPCTAAEEQVKIGIARPAEPWEVLAATLTPEPDLPAWARGLEVASMLHGPDDACAVPELREAATWPN